MSELERSANDAKREVFNGAGELPGSKEGWPAREAADGRGALPRNVAPSGTDARQPFARPQAADPAADSAPEPKGRRKRGRPQALDDMGRKRVAALIGAGASIFAAAKYVGCCPNTIYAVMRRSPDFAKDVRQAHATHEVTLIRRIEKAAEDPKHWSAAAWLLTRGYPDRYATPKPELVTPESVRTLLTGFADILSKEIHCRRDRRAVLRRLQELVVESQPLPKHLCEK